MERKTGARVIDPSAACGRHERLPVGAVVGRGIVGSLIGGGVVAASTGNDGVDRGAPIHVIVDKFRDGHTDGSGYHQDYR